MGKRPTVRALRRRGGARVMAVVVAGTAALAGSGSSVAGASTTWSSPVRPVVGLGGAEPSGASDQPSLSADGGAVAFRSLADNLVAGDTNGVADIFVTSASGGPRRW